MEGLCTNGNRLVRYGSGFGVDTRLFDPSGRFLARRTATDTGGGPTCYAEEANDPPGCDDATISQVLCGGPSEGDRIEW